MAKPLSLTEFLDTIEKSKLIEPSRLEAFCRGQSENTTAASLADRLVTGGLLTRFQADNLLKGRWHRYFLGPYRVMDKIGAGANGMVYLCEHTKMKRRVAVKVLQADKAKDEEVLRRFEREAMAAAAVKHPNIVHAYDLCREEKLHYLVMEYVEGETLLKKLADGGRLGPREAAGFLWQAAAGLQVAHQAGIVHRDVKPSNLMIDKAGKLKILDLGLARFAGDDTDLTRGDAVLGLAAYIAPEQAANSHDVDPRADVYSLGATFFLALTGKKPPVGGGDFTAPAARKPAEAAEYKQLLDVVRKMIATKPADRYQSASDVVFALAPCIDPATTPAPRRPDDALPTPPPARPGSDPAVLTPVPADSAADRRMAVAADFATATLPTPPPPPGRLAPLPPVVKRASAGGLATAVGRPTVSGSAGGGKKTLPVPATASAATSSPPLTWAFLAFSVVAFVAATAYLIWG